MMLKSILRAVFTLALLNFFAFMLLSMINGGDAANGHVLAGHYFLGDHGRFTEVTETEFQFSLAHGQSIWITHPLGILAALWANALDQKKPHSHGAPLC